jgi:tripartite ATP-independent transporter DctP family solute receptor
MVSKKNGSKLLIVMVCFIFLVAFSFAEGSKEAPTGGAEPILIKLGHAQSTSDVFHIASQKFAEICNEKSNGQIKVQVFPAGQLGSIRDMIEGLRIGTLQGVWDTPSRIETYTELASIFNIPYLIENRAHGERVWESEVGEKLFSDMAANSGIRVVSMGWRGSRNMTTNRAIHTPADLKGMKLRVPPYDIPVKTWQTLGANPTPLDWNEVYLALQQGTIDGQENPMSNNISGKLYEVCPYLILTEHVKNFSALMLGDQFYKKLPDDARKIIVEAAIEASKVQGDIVDASEAEFIQKFKDEGVVVINPDISAFKDKLKTFVSDNYPQMEEYVKTIEAMK